MRLRFRFGKVGKIRFLGHRDLARCWERAIRRAELPVAYSEGFNPRPRLHYGLALPTGAESDAEYIDIDLRGDDPSALPTGLGKLLSDGLPVGVDVTGISVLPPGSAALQAVVERCIWELRFTDLDAATVAASAATLFARDEVPLTFERKGKSITEDVRGAILGLAAAPDGPDGPTLLAELATMPRSLRPGELIQCLGHDAGAVRVRRIEQWMTKDGHAQPPLLAGEPLTTDG